MLNGCMTALPAPINSFCLIYIPVYTSSSDTAETTKQVTANNAVWLGLCSEE